jgi:3',5'-cyclic AMP phosphodiesterase CpdA
MDVSTASQTLVALSQPSRMAIFRRLLRAGPDGLTKQALMQEFHFTGGAATLHLKVLEDASLITVDHDTRVVGSNANHIGGAVTCRAQREQLRDLIGFFSHEIDQGMSSCGASPKQRQVR